MAHIDSGGGKGRSKNFDLNLVPFIDLMSVLITFLLISAVWTQVSMIQLGASFASPKDPDQTDIKPPTLEDLVLRLDVRAKGYTLYIGKEIKNIPVLSENVYNTEQLKMELEAVKKNYPDKGGIKLAIEDQIVYDHVVQTMDIGLQAGFSPEILTGGPN